MWRIVEEIVSLFAIGFVSGLFIQSHIHQCPQPKIYSSYELSIYVPTTKEESKKLMLHNRAQHSILQQLEEWEKEKEKQTIPKRGK